MSLKSKLWVCLVLGLLLVATAALADGDKEKRFQVQISGVGKSLFPVGHPFHDPTTAHLLRDDCSAMGWATYRGEGTGRASYIGGIKNVQSHCAQLDPPGVGFPTGFFTAGHGTFYGAGTDKDGVLDTLTYDYTATVVPGVPTGISPWCNPLLGPCPATGNGLVTQTGGTGRFSSVSGGQSVAFVLIYADESAAVSSDGTLISNGPLPGSY